MSPIKGAAAADAQLAKASTDLLAENVPSFELYYQRFLTGTEQGLGTILQGYCAGQTDRAETIAQLDSFYTKLAKAR